MRGEIQMGVGNCQWKEDSDGNWETSCGEAFCLEEGTPVENTYNYCPACGGILKEKRYVEAPC